MKATGCVHYPATYVGCPGHPCDPPCDDENSCTQDQCVLFSGCVYTPVSGPCDDGDACTASGTCTKGTCVSNAVTKCDDEDPCTTDACVDGECTYQAVAGCCHPKSECGDDGDPCTTLLCASADGPCHFAILANGAYCDDGDICRWGTTCTAGVCGGGSLVDCPDGSACQLSSCDAKAGCRFDPLCPDEGNPCTAESCSAGVCGRVAVSGVCPGGTCLAGACRGPGDTVVLGDLRVDRLEVSVASYSGCVGAGMCPDVCPVGECAADGPVDGVDGATAAAYCSFAGGRLCKVEEWRVAAFGHDGRLWPWGGAAPDCDRINATIAGAPCAVGPLPPGRPEGASAFGAEDMAGNVAEWVLVPDVGVFAVGGSYAGPPELLFDAQDASVEPTLAGIRCCYDGGAP
ncbi:MAG: SUMF1/EgtB/PvdO family nonheme iron enzyme [Myxococcales bacterium]|nr:SUMF1/EgtB/PvdO family nonheme iron enzyme [Myxococcales bacterium]